MGVFIVPPRYCPSRYAINTAHFKSSQVHLHCLCGPLYGRGFVWPWTLFSGLKPAMRIPAESELNGLM